MKHRLLWRLLIGLLAGASGIAFAANHEGATHLPAFGVEHEALAVTPYSSSGQCGVERW